MSDGEVGLSATIGFGDGASVESFTSVAEVVSMSGPGFTRESVDFTHMTSADDYMEYKPGMKDGGEVSFEGRWLPGNASHDASTGVLSLFEAGTTDNWKLTFPDGSDFTFAAFVTAIEPSIGGVNDPVNMSVTLKVTGKPTLTQAA